MHALCNNSPALSQNIKHTTASQEAGDTARTGKVRLYHLLIQSL